MALKGKFLSSRWGNLLILIFKTLNQNVYTAAGK
jgi:hypothetical protein